MMTALVMSLFSCMNSIPKFKSDGKILVDKDSVSYSIADSLITDKQSLISEIGIVSSAAKTGLKHPLTFKPSSFQTRKFPPISVMNQPLSYREELLHKVQPR